MDENGFVNNVYIYFNMEPMAQHHWIWVNTGRSHARALFEDIDLTPEHLLLLTYKPFKGNQRRICSLSR